MDNKMGWSFYQIWNESLEESKAQKPLAMRDNVWASELGGSLVDRFLKMNAITPSNPPNPRSLRKFEAGNIWETIVGYVLTRAGILQDTQKWVSFQYPELLKVTGKLDFIAGGKPDYDKSLAIIAKEFSWLPPFISRAIKNIIAKLQFQYPDGLKNIVLEVKSCSSFMFEIYEQKNTASLAHKLQIFHYLKAENMDEGHIVYVSKDDARLLEVGISYPSPVEDAYKEDITQLTYYISHNEQPPPEKFLVFDKDMERFSANYKVGYSQYLTHLYEFQSQKDFDDIYKPVAERWNRVLGRIKAKKEMTDDNKKAIEEMASEGFNVDNLL